MSPKLCVFGIWIGGYYINLFCQARFHFRRDAKGIHISAEAGNLFLGNPEIFFDFFQIASMEMFFSFYFFMIIHFVLARLFPAVA